MIFLKSKQTSPDNNFDIDTVPQKTFTKVEIEAEYPGGKNAWGEYLMKNLKYPEDAVKRNIQGTVIVRVHCRYRWIS